MRKDERPRIHVVPGSDKELERLYRGARLFRAACGDAPPAARVWSQFVMDIGRLDWTAAALLLGAERAEYRHPHARAVFLARSMRGAVLTEVRRESMVELASRLGVTLTIEVTREQLERPELPEAPPIPRFA